VSSIFQTDNTEKFKILFFLDNDSIQVF